MPFVKKSRPTRDSEKLSGEQREKKLSELEGEYKKYWDARSKLLEAESFSLSRVALISLRRA